MANVNGMYNYLSVGEIIRLYQTFGDRVVIHNGNVTGFVREDNTDIQYMYKNIFR